MNGHRIEDYLVLATSFFGRRKDPEPVLPRPERLDSIRSLVTSSLRPVRPLPSDATLICIALGLFIAFSLLAAVPVDYRGFHRLSTMQRLAYYPVITVCALLFSVSLVHEIIPGSRRRIHPALGVVFSLFSLASVAFGLFPNHHLAHFANLGLRCLGLGITCALVSGLLAYLLLRKGFAASPVRATTLTGFFAGLTGVAVLALHCPLQDVFHILVWHLGAMLTAGACGALLGWWRVHVRTPTR